MTLEQKLQEVKAKANIRLEMAEKAFKFLKKNESAEWYNVIINHEGVYHHEVLVRAVDECGFEITRERVFITANPELVKVAASVAVEVMNELKPKTCSTYPLIESKL